MVVGDNIYWFESSRWHQADSHHSLADGSPNLMNIKNDTSSDSVLVSSNFFYFGESAPLVPKDVLAQLGYKNGRSHRTFQLDEVKPLLAFLHSFPKNQVLADPFDFHTAWSRYTGVGSQVK